MILLLACIGTTSPAPDETGDLSIGETGQLDDGPVQVAFSTTLGDFVIELDHENSPVTSDNFLVYVDEGFFDGDDGEGAVLFHRVIPGFVAQGGGVLPNGTEKATHDPIVNESSAARRNVRGSVAMARTNDPDSATSQFFINVVDNDFLDVDGSYPPGYAVFGTVTEGMEVIDAMVDVPTNSQDRPDTDIVIEDAERL